MNKMKKGITLFLALVMVITMFPVQAQAASVKINKTKAVIYVGSRETLKIKGTSKQASWKSSDKSIASVSSKGVVTAKKAGTATITAKVEKKSYKCKVTVKKPYLNKTKLSLNKGKTYQLKITGTKANSWKSSDTKVASVSGSGKIKAKKAGTATITCKGKDKKTYKCKVTVKESYEDQIYAKIIAKKKSYPEGMKWTNDNYYGWKGGIYAGGYGCAGFAFMLSDAAFGSQKASMHKDFNNLRVGDILRMDKDTHSVIILEVKKDKIVVAEGNYNSSVHWGREISLSEVRSTGTYVMTRYPK